jgi:hypothetical protein
MISGSILAWYERPSKRFVVLFLSVSEEETLSELCEFFRSTSLKNQTSDLPCKFRESDDLVLNKVLVRKIESGLAERITVKNDTSGEVSLLWEGDHEYWLECAEKVAPFLKSAGGHQYLMVRGANRGNVVLSYRERHVSW